MGFFRLSKILQLLTGYLVTGLLNQEQPETRTACPPDDATVPTVDQMRQTKGSLVVVTARLVVITPPRPGAPVAIGCTPSDR